MDPKSGLTEDTNLNVMRWNQKFKEKMFRYDAIFYKPSNDLARSYQIKISNIMGTEVQHLSEDNSKWFIDTISEKKDLAFFRGILWSESSKPLIPINPSDHFGVMTTFGKEMVRVQVGKGKTKSRTKYVLRKIK
jgi:hypothetical protein